jgi:hypothetical protein
MTLVPYTNTYTDVDDSIADAVDIIAEFDRVALFINTWSDSYESIGLTNVNQYLVPGNSNVDVDPALGVVQAMITDAVVEEVNVNIQDRNDGDPYRVYLSMRFGSNTTAFTVSAPAGDSHVFGINRTSFLPSQVANNGWYSAVLIVTYGTTGIHVQVFADNRDTEAVDSDDMLQEVGV